MLREQGHRIWLLVSNSKIQRQKGIWRQVSSSVIPVLARQTALAVEVLTASAGREGVRNRETHRITGLCTSSRCSPSLWGGGGPNVNAAPLPPCSPLSSQNHGWPIVVGDTPKIYFSCLRPEAESCGKLLTHKAFFEDGGPRSCGGLSRVESTHLGRG